MRIVIDTNVVIAGLYSKRGASFQILKAALSKNLEYVISPLVALEYIGKVEDKVNEGLLDQPSEYYLAITKLLVDNGIQILRPVLNRPTLKDITDDKILECAITGQCDYILTFNTKDFPNEILERYDLTAITPGEYIRTGGLESAKA